MSHNSILKLQFSDGRDSLTALGDINSELADIGSRIWPLIFENEPDDIKELLKHKTLTDDESKLLLFHFELPRERLLKIIKGAGREPQVPGGGALSTYVLPHDYSYPQLYLIAQGEDYSRFDRFHVNMADDGTAVDEVMQILSGGGVILHQRLPEGDVLNLTLNSPGENAGWVVTYDGEYPHIGSISGAQAGTKVLMQIIGPERWVMRYDGEQ